MNIQAISKADREVTVILNADELVILANSLYETQKKKTNSKIKRLYSDIMLCRDLCQYGHVDDWCLEKIVEQRLPKSNCKNEIKKPK